MCEITEMEKERKLISISCHTFTQEQERALSRWARDRQDFQLFLSDSDTCIVLVQSTWEAAQEAQNTFSWIKELTTSVMNNLQLDMCEE